MVGFLLSILAFVLLFRLFAFLIKMYIGINKVRSKIKDRQQSYRSTNYYKKSNSNSNSNSNPNLREKDISNGVKIIEEKKNSN